MSDIDISSFPIKVPFPPPIDESELKPSMKKGKLPVRATNQFLLYRTAFIKTLRENGINDINMRTISKMASDLWNLEPEFVQQEYKTLALKAKGLHQKTAKYLTSCHAKDTISNRPLAPMPKSTSKYNQDSLMVPSDISNIKEIEIKEPVADEWVNKIDIPQFDPIINNSLIQNDVAYPTYYIPQYTQYTIAHQECTNYYPMFQAENENIYNLPNLPIFHNDVYNFE